MPQVEEQGRAFSGAAAPRYRRFGPLGPVYEVEQIKGQVARVRVIETGEALDYPVERLEQDPAA